MPLVIKDFSKQNIVSKDDIINLINNVPKSNLKGLQYIVYDPIRFYQRSYVNPVIPDYRVKGAYHQQLLDAVIIYEVKDKQLFAHTLYHEIGHYVFNRIMTPKERKHWVTKLYPERVFVSGYAKTNAQEDFAESYAFFLLKRTFGHSLRAKYNFLVKLTGR